MLLSFSHQIVSNSSQPLEWQHTRPPCPSPFPGRVCPNSCPLHRWCRPTISSSVTLFSFCLHYTGIKSHDLCFTVDTAVDEWLYFIVLLVRGSHFFLFFAHCQIMWQCYATDLKVTCFNGKQIWWYKDRHCSNSPQLCTTSFLCPSKL